MGKEAFMMYTGFWKPISRLKDEQLGRLFRALYLYQLGEPCEIAEDIQMAYDFFVNQFDIDSRKYDEKIDARREAGKAGAESRWSRKGKKEANDGAEECPDMARIANMANATVANDDMAKITNDSKHSYNENENENENENVFFQKKEKRLICEKFFLAGADSPVEETERFLDFNSGKPPGRLMQYAAAWKFLCGQGGRNDPGPLDWLSHVVKAAEGKGDIDAVRRIITGIRARDTLDSYTIRCTDKAVMATIEAYASRKGKKKIIYSIQDQAL